MGLALVAFDQTALSILGAWTVDVKLSLSFLLWLLGYVVGLCTFVFIKMDIMYLTLIYGFVM